MFDEQDQKVEDMFGAVDGGVPPNLPFAPSPGANPAPAPAADAAPLAAPMETPTYAQPATMPQTVVTPPPPPEDILAPRNDWYGRRGPGVGRMIGAAFIALVSIALVAGSAYLGLQYMAQQKLKQEDLQNGIEDNELGAGDEMPTEVQDPAPEQPVLTQPEPALPVSESPDTDGDGLSDAEEDQLGTDLTLTDTDADGLNDAEEVRMYGTDPLNQDTDGDTHVDGVEVVNGYNPNGTGRLFQPLPPRTEDK